MKLSDVFTYLATGELAQVFLSETGGRDTIDSANQLPMAQSVQLGLTALYKRFNLKNRDITVQFIPGRTSYTLTKKHLVSSTTLDVAKYIEDDPENKFKDDILKIERLITLDGLEYPLNDRSNRYSATTPTPNTLLIPELVVNKGVDLPDAYKVDKLKVVYRANHPVIIPSNGLVQADKVEIELPSTHLQALLYYVASRKTNPVGMVNEFNAGNTWYQKYEMECKQLEREGMGEEVDLNTIRFQRGGWV